MISRCFLRQHPEQFDRPAVDEPPIPHELRYGQTEHIAEPPAIPEEPSGNGEVAPLDTVVVP